MPEIWVCSRCKGDNVEVAKWVNPNTLEINHGFSVYDAIIDEDTGCTLSHCNDCDELVTLEFIRK